MKKSDLLSALAMLILCGVLLAGCAAKAPCYSIIGADPSTQTAILFDACKGRVIHQTLPPPSTPRVEGE